MAELTTQERLQPSLLDRLTDAAPFKERVELLVRDDALEGAGMTRADFHRLMDAHQFALVRERSDDRGDVEIREGGIGGNSLAQLLEHRFRPSAGAAEVCVGDLVEVLQRRRVANTTEGRRDRVISGKRLRESVMRDLAWLLNTCNLATVTPLAPDSEVRSSVMNYGVPDLAGVTASSADVEAVAEGLRHAIAVFEPRLRNVRVTPWAAASHGRGNALSFLIEAELWGQPSAQHLALHTELDLESAAATVRDAEGQG